MSNRVCLSPLKDQCVLDINCQYCFYWQEPEGEQMKSDCVGCYCYDSEERCKVFCFRNKDIDKDKLSTEEKYYISDEYTIKEPELKI